jgi:hypothetical protein
MDFESTHFSTNVTNIQTVHKSQLITTQSALSSEKPMANPFLFPQDFPKAFNLPNAWTEPVFVGGAAEADFTQSDKFFGGDRLFKSMPREKHDDSCSAAKQGQLVTINKSLTKNMYFIVMKYLKNNEVISLALTCKKIWERVSRDDYFRRLLTESYLRFFNSQFSVHQLPFETFIPLMKQ